MLSHPAWVRGLKLIPLASNLFIQTVAPRVGAWIETVRFHFLFLVHGSHPAWVRGLKRVTCSFLLPVRGRTPRGCVDWNTIMKIKNNQTGSRTPRGCVDWNDTDGVSYFKTPCRTPRGCVDWNPISHFLYLFFWVAPRVGAWIETQLALSNLHT